MSAPRYIVTTNQISGLSRPVIGVDGPVRGADLLFDHHATGEAVNLLAIPDDVPMPGTVATTMLDGDAAISAAVVILRGRGEHRAVEAVWPPLYEAAHYCDYLVPSGKHGDAEQAGLGLHCWLKERGFALGEVLAWARGEWSAAPGEPRPSTRTKSQVFGHLSQALVEGIHAGALPCDFVYLERLKAMEQEARAAVKRVDEAVTIVVPRGYVDPMALYRVVDTDIVVITGDHEGGVHYTLGVHPRAYGRIDLRPVLTELDRREPGWGGRSNAGGSPLDVGSRLTLDEVIGVVRSAPRSR